MAKGKVRPKKSTSTQSNKVMRRAAILIVVIAAVLAIFVRDELSKSAYVAPILSHPLYMSTLAHITPLTTSVSDLLSPHVETLRGIVSGLPAEVQLNVIGNGESTPNVTHLLQTRYRRWADIKVEIASLIFTAVNSTTVVDLYDEVGNRLSSSSYLTAAMDVYVAINGDLYMHPGKYVGFTRQVAGFTMVTLSVSPRVLLVKQFFPQEECDSIVKDALALELHRSAIYETKKGETSSFRSSSTGYVRYTKPLLDKAFGVTKLPEDYSYLYPDYQLQVIHYHPNQYFHPHHDGFFASAAGHEGWFENGQRNRYLTLFLYLNDVEEGGETAFVTKADYEAFYRQADKYDLHTNNPCDKPTVKMTPSKGDGILFYNLQAGKSLEAAIDWTAVHTGCGVKKGEKWACNIWMYNRPTVDPAYVSILRQFDLAPPLPPAAAAPENPPTASN